MIGRPFVIKWQEADTAEALKAAYQGERDPARRSQLQGLWLLRTGRRLEEVADVVGVHYRTVQRWAAWYREGGLAAIRAHKMGGKGQAPKLTPDQQRQVSDAVATGRFRVAAEIGEWIQEAFGVEYRPNGLYALLARLDCRPKVPRPRHTKADPEQQAAWKRGASSRRSAGWE